MGSTCTQSPICTATPISYFFVQCLRFISPTGIYIHIYIYIYIYIYIIKSEKICFQIFPVSHLNKENISLIEGCMHQTGFSLPMLLLGWSFLLLSFST